MSALESKVDRIVEDIGEIKVTIAKQEVNLCQLTKSVDYHIKRTDDLQEIVTQVSEANKKANLVVAAKVQAQSEKSKKLWFMIKTVMSTLAAVGSVLLALHELGILNNLIK